MIDIDTKPETTAEYTQLLKDRNWRLHNLYKIKNKDGKKVTFRPNRAQRQFMSESHDRDLILKSRQHGFTTLIQVLMLDECLFVPNTNAGVIAHNQDDAQAFFKDKIKFAYDNLAPHLKEMFPASNDSARELRFENGSVIRVGTSLRSGTYQLLHISEYGKLCAKFPDRAKEVKSGSLPTVPIDGKIWIESTAEGRSGHFYELSTETQQAKQLETPLTTLDFKFHFYAWHEDDANRLEGNVIGIHQWDDYFKSLEVQGVPLDDAQKAWYVKTAQTQRDDMKKEHPSTPEEAFEAAVEGAYFAKQMLQVREKRQICRIPIEPGIPIHTFWDLGRDTTSIWFFQNVGFDYRFINYFQNSGEGMAYYLNVLKEMNDGGAAYLYGDMYLPHDGIRRGMAETSPADQMFNNGYSVRVVERTSDKDLSIERARNVLPKCYFDEDRCIKGISCLDGYRHEWDDKLGDWKKQPLHDISSHGADSFMTFADGFHAEREIEEDQDSFFGNEGRNGTTGY